jgi:hypothetical protein
MASRLRQALVRLGSEPLVHFLVLGGALFALHRRVAGPDVGRHVVVSRQLIGALRQDHQRRHGAPPSPDEEKAALARYIEEETLYREALSLGLHRGDVIIRRRLVQKMELLSEPDRPVPPPSSAELEAFVSAHPGRYDSPVLVSLVHVFASTERHGERAGEVLEALLPALQGGGDPARMGDPFVHGQRLSGSRNEMAKRLGVSLAGQIEALPVGSWRGPLRSTFGAHLIKIESRQQGQPALDRAREDWREERKQEAARESLRKITARYTVDLDEGGR